MYAAFNVGAFLSLVVGVALGCLPALGLIGLATIPLAVLASRSAFSYKSGWRTLIPALAMNVAATLLTPSLVAAGLLLA